MLHQLRRQRGTWISSFYIGFTSSNPSLALSQMNGVIYQESSTKLAGITDGTSNTFLFGEALPYRVAAQISPKYAIGDGKWNSGNYYDGMVSTFYPPNLQSNAAGIASYTYYGGLDASSLHPGGLNFAFCDGSVHFVKNSISSWSFSQHNVDSSADGDSIPNGVTMDLTNWLFTMGTGTQLGIYQALSTRAGGEVISSDSY